MKRATTYAVAAALAAGFTMASSGVAQTYQPSQQQQQLQQEQQSRSISDQDLQTYAEAANEVKAINEEYMPQMLKAESPQAQMEIRNEAQGKMVEAIRDNGLTVDQYNRITTAARNDPQTAAKINELMR